MNQGVLYLVGTPIGNLEDLTYRAVRIMKECDFVAAEDTRVSGKLLHYLEISKPMVSYHEHNRKQRGPEIVRRILQGETCALMTDAGMPAISDPGEDLAALCHEAGITVIPIPGACAAVCALAQSGLPSGKWCFEGFLPTDRKSRKQRLEVLQNETRTCILYEAPHRLKATLRDLAEALGDRRIAMSREITKLHEECLRMTLTEAVSYYEENDPRGEYVLVIDGAEENAGKESPEQLMERALALTQELSESGMTLRDAVKHAAKQTGVRKNQLYQKALERQE
jgi:16S rRNA (cytidine1402-2'-O)-methyltransferase